MHPHELSSSLVGLPKGPKDSAILVTGGTSPRYQRFAYRIQSEFPGLVKKWFALAPKQDEPERRVGPARLVAQSKMLHAKFQAKLKAEGRKAVLKTLRDRIEERRLRSVFHATVQMEHELFGAEVESLKGPRRCVQL